MGRGHLISQAAALVAVALGLTAPAAARVGSRLLADGRSTGRGPSRPTGYVALDREATGRFAAPPGGGGAALSRLDDAGDAVFAEFGCEGPLLEASSLAQHGSSLAVRPVQDRRPPGSARWRATFDTYRLLAAPKASLRSPYPTRAPVTVARA